MRGDVIQQSTIFMLWWENISLERVTDKRVPSKVSLDVTIDILKEKWQVALLPEWSKK